MDTAKTHPLGGLSPEQFLKEYWQKKPLLVRQAFPNFQSPVDPDDLAGLALEDSIESRVIEEFDGNGHWTLKNGPFSEKDFEELGNKDSWTLLVQQLDAWVPEVDALKAYFDFIPSWRIDDIMASYAPVNGSVGPHFDQYDVFLIQASGQRQWQIGQWCDTNTTLRDDTSLSILRDFNESDAWLLEPGDMLYLPPKLAHFGRSKSNDCITLSVGFRAPANTEILEGFSQHVIDSLQKQFYEDPELSVQKNCGELLPESIEKLRTMALHHLNDERKFAIWLGEYLSSPKNHEVLQSNGSPPSWLELEAMINDGACLFKNEGSRFTFSAQENEVLLFCDGSSFCLPDSDFTFVQYLSNSARPDAHTLVNLCSTISSKQCMCELIRNGSVVVEE